MDQSCLNSWFLRKFWKPGSILAMESAGIVYLSPRGRVLWLKRALGDHLGAWDFPGGRLKPGETAWDGARRESIEETGVDPYHVGMPVLGQYSAREGHHAFLWQAHGEFEPALSHEHSDWTWALPASLPRKLKPHPGSYGVLSDLLGSEG